MKNYDVTIRATVMKTIRVTTKTEDDAWDLAHEIFNVNVTTNAEHYEQETVSIEEVDDERTDI